MTCFALSAEPASIPATDKILPVAVAISPDINEMASSFDSLQNELKNNEWKELESREDNTSEWNREIASLEPSEITAPPTELSASPPMDSTDLLEEDLTSGAEPEPGQEIKPSKDEGNPMLTVFNKSALCLGWTKPMKTAVPGDAEYLDVKSASEPEYLQSSDCVLILASEAPTSEVNASESNEIASLEPSEIAAPPAELPMSPPMDGSEEDLAASVDAETDPGQALMSSEGNQDATLTMLKKLALYLGRIKQMETAGSGDTENSVVKSPAEPEPPTPEVNEISGNPNEEPNQIEVVLENQGNEPDDEINSLNQ
jgi:hypothetical protein